MTKPLLSIAAFATALAASAPAFAQAEKAPVPPTRAELVTGLEARFKRIDTNGDGAIVKSEIEVANARAAQEAAATLASRLTTEFAKLDTNKDNLLSLDEFKASAPQAKAAPGENALNRLDTSKDQKVSLTEFSAVALTAFDRIDKNKDGRISDAEREALRQPQGR